MILTFCSAPCRGAQRFQKPSPQTTPAAQHHPAPPPMSSRRRPGSISRSRHSRKVGRPVHWCRTTTSGWIPACTGMTSCLVLTLCPASIHPPPRACTRVEGFPPNLSTFSRFSPQLPFPLCSPHCLYEPAGRANRLVKGQVGRGCRDPCRTAEVSSRPSGAQGPESRRDQPKIPPQVARLCLTTQQLLRGTASPLARCQSPHPGRRLRTPTNWESTRAKCPATICT
jgi:hypothetical protein